MPTPEFDPTTHTYSYSGKAFPSVTQIIASDPSLSGLGSVNKAVLAAAAEKGTDVHDYLALRDERSIPPFPDFDGYEQQWVEAMSVVSALPPGDALYEMIETPLFHPNLGYAGTPDRVYHSKRGIIIVDIKTGAESKSHRIQTAGYAYLVARHLTPDDPTIPTYLKRVAVYLKPDRYTAVWHDNPADYSAWMALRNLYFWKQAP